jgi:type II secretory pathway pseudopilin PulG
MLEIVAAVALLAVLLAVAMRGATAVAAQRRALAHRETAVREAANLAERLAARPWNELVPEKPAAAGISDEAAASLAEAVVKVDVATPAADPAAKRVSVELTWLDSTGLPQRPARVVFWKYRTARE